MAITRVGYATTASAGPLDVVVSPDGTIATDDWLVAVVASNAPNTATTPSGWTALASNATTGTLNTSVFTKKRAIGEAGYTFHISGGFATVALMWLRGAADTGWVIGTGRSRSTTGSGFNNIADPITTTAVNSLALTISTERTTAAETDIASMTGATEWFFKGGTSGPETVAVGYSDRPTAGATPSVTIAYPNTQASNGYALQLAVPPSVAAPTPPGLKGSIWTGTQETPVYATMWNGTAEVPIASFNLYTGNWHIADLLSTTPFYIAHRGGGGNWPEHTFRSYSSAANHGMKAIEVSAQMTSDGQIVCHHDPSTLRMTGVDKTISATPKAQLDALTNTAANTDNPTQPREPIPLLSTVLAAYASNHVLFIEPKTGGFDTALMNMIDSYPDTANRIVWKTYINAANFAAAKARGYMTWGYVISTDPSHTNNLDTLIPNPNVDMIGVERIASDAFVADIVARANAVGKRTIMWEIRSIADRDRALALGCVGMMTSNLRAVLPKFP